MKQQVSPVVAVIAILVVLGLAAFGWTRFTGVSHEDKPAPTMPPAVAKQWAEYTKGAPAGPPAGGGPGATGSTIPGVQSAGAAPPRGGGIGPPPGIRDGYNRGR